MHTHSTAWWSPNAHHYARDPWRNWDQGGGTLQDFQNHYGRVPLRSYDTGVGSVTVQTWNYPHHGYDYSYQLRQGNHYQVETRRNYDRLDDRGRGYDDHHYRRENYYERRY